VTRRLAALEGRPVPAMAAVMVALALFSGGYQGDIDRDRDPDWEASKLGVTEKDSYEASIIYPEVARDASLHTSLDEQWTVTHEIGHQVLESDNHYPNSIMVQGHDTNYLSFTDECIALIRAKTDSPGT